MIADIISKLYVVVGSLEPLKEGSPAVERYNKLRKIEPIQEIKEAFIHNAYKSLKKEAYYDIAIIRLDNKVPIIEGKINPICLPRSKRFIKRI